GLGRGHCLVSMDVVWCSNDHGLQVTTFVEHFTVVGVPCARAPFFSCSASGRLVDVAARNQLRIGLLRNGWKMRNIGDAAAAKYCYANLIHGSALPKMSMPVPVM